MSTPEIIQGIIEVPQREVVLLLEVGYLYMELNKHDEAKEVFEGVAALVPQTLCRQNMETRGCTRSD